MQPPSLFASFFLGGFECSTQRLRNGKRLDVLAASGQDRYALLDYQRLQAHGIRTVRGGLRWHLVEPRPGYYDFRSVMPLLHAAQTTHTQVIWDLCHFGWPEDLDIFRPAFVRRFADLARAFAQFVAHETDEIPFYTPINEISFWAWAGGDAAYLNPFATGRGFELKVQLVRAAIAGTEAIWSVDPRARIVHTDPVIHVIADGARPQDQPQAEGHRLAQYQAWDILCGRLWPQVGGDSRYLDIIGVDYYPTNQWIHAGPIIDREHPQYRPFRDILAEVYARYQRPLFVAETGTEDTARHTWFRYICTEVRAALHAGVPVEGVCLYPIVNHPGWDDDRHCHNGLFDYPDANGHRETYQPLAQELQQQMMTGIPGQVVA